MKSSKVVVKSNLMSRLGHLSAITVMALSLSVGTVRAAEDFKLWHAVVGDAKGEELLHASDDNSSDSVKWLVKDASDKNIQKFVDEFSKEPFQFLEGMKAAKESAEKDSKLDALKKTISEKIFGDKSKIKDKSFGGKKERQALKELVEAMMEKDKLGKDFLSDLFVKPSILADLNLKGAEKKPEPSKSPAPSTTPTPTAVPPTTPTVGEIDDGSLQRQAQQICDKFNGLRDENLKSLKDQISPLQAALDAANEKFNKLASQPGIDPNLLQAQKKNEKGLEDILPGLLANALNNDKDNQVTPSSNQQQQPFFPQQQQRRNDDQQSNLNQPVPDPGPQQPQQSGGMPMMPYQAATAAAPIRVNLPSASGRQELRDAQDALSAIQMRQPVASTLGMNAGLPDLVMAKAKVRTDIQKAQGALVAAKDRAARLDEQLEELKDQALPPEAKRKMTQLEGDLNQKKQAMQQQQQMLQMLAPEQRQDAQQMMYMQQQQVAQSEQALNNYKAEMDIAAEKMSAAVKSLSKTRDNLQSVTSKLESEVSGLKEEETSVQQLINTNMQMQMSQNQPQQPGTPNINRLQGFGGGNTSGPRTTAPRLGAALQSAAGADVRGSLGAQK